MSGMTLLPYNPLLNLAPWVGQRQCTFRFDLVNAVTGEDLGQIHPLRGASLTHDTTRTIKRQLSLSLGAEDTATINTVQSRVLPYMVFPDGQQYPLGRYQFTDNTRTVFTSGKLGATALNDEMFLVDQSLSSGVDGFFRGVNEVLDKVLDALPIDVLAEASPYTCNQSWGVGTGRGSLLEALAVIGDFFSPWFDNTGVMRFIRSFDPATRIPELDWDTGDQVFRTGITETDDLLTAPNKFVVISNASDNLNEPVVGTASVPPTAPHSLANRGFEILEQQDLQVSNIIHAQAVANNLANRQTIFERVSLTTAPDPRHDSYNVIRWQGELWLELAWSLSLVEGGEMNHLLRKAYHA
jgi:hypothetical protein